MSDELEDYRQEIKTYQQNEIRLENRIEELKTELEAARDALNDIKANTEVSKIGLLSRLHNERTKNDQLRAELEAARQRVEALEDRQIDLMAENHDANAELEAGRAKNANLRESAEILKRLEGEARARIAELEAHPMLTLDTTVDYPPRPTFAEMAQLKAKVAYLEHRAVAAETAHVSANKLLVEAEARAEKLEAANRWIPVQNMPVGLTGPYFASTGEFGFAPTLIVARCWMGSENRDPIWYLDEKFYHLDNPLMVAEQVTHYRPLPDPLER
jgi:chromosome segregation ATPase